MSFVLPPMTYEPCDVISLLALIDSVLRENQFWVRLNWLRFTDDARNSLWEYFTQHPEKLGSSPAHAAVAIRYTLKDILREKSENGVTHIPREVYRFPKGEEKDTRRFVLEFSNADYDADAQGDANADDHDVVFGCSSQEPFAVLRSLCAEAIIAELEQHADYQQLLRVFNARTMAEKAAAMGCKPAKVRQRMNAAYQRIHAFISERMGMFGD